MDKGSHLTRIWCVAIVVTMVVTQTTCIAGHQTDSPVTTADSRVEMPVPSPAIHADCMAEWLQLAGASPERIASLRSSGSLVLAKLDENFVNHSSSLLLTFALGFDTKLAGQLRACISGTKPCPAGSDATDRPCTQSGECVFSEVSRDTQCNCTYGLLGKRCRQDLDECSRSDLNDCDVTNGYCVNIHGSFACECKVGFYEDAIEGRRCKDIDECRAGSDGCHRNATCINTAGSYGCQCNRGFHGDGFECDYDLCQGSPNSGMCRKVSSLENHVTSLEDKLRHKDAQVKQLSEDMKLVLALMTNYDRRLKTEEQNTRQEMDTRFKSQQQQFQEQNQTLSERISQLDDKCEGILQWKTFSRTSRKSSDQMSAWNVQFEKRRNDTSLRLLYTTSMGVQSNSWECFTLSFLFNGSECSDPAPIRGGVSAYQGSLARYNQYNRQSTPAAISGVCNIDMKGLLTITSSSQDDCQAGYNNYHGYYQGNRDITSSLHIDEMCP